MTEPNIKPEIDPLLEHSPACEQTCHSGGSSAKADWWVRAHNCGDYFVCDPCYIAWGERGEQAMGAWGVYLCGRCGQGFSLREQAYKATKL